MLRYFLVSLLSPVTKKNHSLPLETSAKSENKASEKPQSNKYLYQTVEIFVQSASTWENGRIPGMIFP